MDEFDIKAADGSSLGSKIAEWAEADMQEVSRLSAGLTNLVQNALTDGIIDVDEQAAIDQLQSKISNIMSGWQEAEAQAEMDMLTQKYGRLSGKDLTDGTFLKLVEEMENQRETAMAALEEDEKEVYTTLNALNRKDENGIQRISDSELAYYKQQAGYASRNSEASMLAEEVNFEMNTLSDAYGEKLSQNYNQIQSDTESLLSDANTMLQNQDYASLADSLRYGFGSAMTGTSFFSDEDQGTLSQIYDAMKPNFDSMAGIIDEYRAMGQAVPQDIMDSFNSAMLLGAASGDAADAGRRHGEQRDAGLFRHGEPGENRDFHRRDAGVLAESQTADGGEVKYRRSRHGHLFHRPGQQRGRRKSVPLSSRRAGIYKGGGDRIEEYGI